MIKKIYQLILLSAVVFTTACSNDNDYHYPNLITNFTELKSNSNGKAFAIITDDNKELFFNEISSLNKLTPDSIYRTISRYEYDPNEENNHIKLYALSQVIAPIPVLRKDFKEIKNDPVKIQSISSCKRYINIVLNILKKDHSHAFHFIQDSITNNNDNTKTLHITLYHNSNNDTQAFYETTYLSIPLWAYDNTLKSGDKIEVNINTYDNGIVINKFAF